MGGGAQIRATGAQGATAFLPPAMPWHLHGGHTTSAKSMWAPAPGHRDHLGLLHSRAVLAGVQ